MTEAMIVVASVFALGHCWGKDLKLFNWFGLPESVLKLEKSGIVSYSTGIEL